MELIEWLSKPNGIDQARKVARWIRGEGLLDLLPWAIAGQYVVAIDDNLCFQETYRHAVRTVDGEYVILDVTGLLLDICKTMGIRPRGVTEYDQARDAAGKILVVTNKHSELVQQERYLPYLPPINKYEWSANLHAVASLMENHYVYPDTILT